jgi:phosphatidylethanolamine-binding protein (PEBP) family uncharacterized protein
MHHHLPSWATLTLAAALSACSPQAIQQQVSGSLQIKSTSVASGALPDSAGCKGAGVSPQISWSAPPAGTKSLALILDDMPAERLDLTEGLPRDPLPDGTQQGTNDAHEFGYSGPCPYAGSTHHYAITVYALDTTLGLPVATTGGQLLTAIDGHILAGGQILVTYTH